MDTTSSIHLTEDLVIDILLRSPILTCFRFRTVCKSWYSLLSDPIFMYKNLTSINSHDEKEEDNQLLIKRGDIIARRNYFSLISYDNLKDYIPLTMEKEIENNLFITVVGCSNGLVCLTDTLRKIFVWNLSTKETKVLPESDSIKDHNSEIVVGFFFDDKTNDYKVVKISDIQSGLCSENRVECYSFRSDSWKKIDYPCEVYWSPYGTPTNFDGQFIHWLTTTVDEDFLDTLYEYYVIVSLDVNVELFKTSVTPYIAYIRNKHSTLLTLISFFMLKKFVAICTSPPPEAAEPVYQISVLLKIGVEESWVKLISVRPLISLYMEGILGCWKYGKLVLHTSKGELILFDPFTREIVPLSSNGTPSSIFRFPSGLPASNVEILNLV